jgi:hypothetical protein
MLFRFPDPDPISAAPRMGWCCQYIPPDGDREATKVMNPGTVTIATLRRLDPIRITDKLLDVVRRNLRSLHLQLAEIAQRPVTGGFCASTAACCRPIPTRSDGPCTRNRRSAIWSKPD